MKPLTFHLSKRLFLKRMFSSDECPDQLQAVSDEILKECGGLPLAIISNLLIWLVSK
jgi:disease resistance protein RPM1